MRVREPHSDQCQAGWPLCSVRHPPPRPQCGHVGSVREGSPVWRGGRLWSHHTKAPRPRWGARARAHLWLRCRPPLPVQTPRAPGGPGRRNGLSSFLSGDFKGTIKLLWNWESILKIRSKCVFIPPSVDHLPQPVHKDDPGADQRIEGRGPPCWGQRP